MRIVIDTNIVISGIFFGGKPRLLLEKWFSGKYCVLCTEEILDEYINTIKKVTEKLNRNIGKEIFPLLIENLELIQNDYHEQYSRDPDDDKFINCARSGRASHIITGDNDLLVLKAIENVKIIELSEFLMENIR